ncbi:hypothetical protein ILUMI_12276 [Ignelater luminosus]|uniref:Uncharacterized protein n=1 Tax=Ignelater luminosus TaxID=2038154 RepID=A0A8K0CWS5_IGNLU|nr:hypothetical protein ILUMI_12276 [Ignelater luminosus]
MAGDENVPYDDPSLKGIGRIFNNSTIRGRANVSMTAYELPLPHSLEWLSSSYIKFLQKIKKSNVRQYIQPQINMYEAKLDKIISKMAGDGPVDQSKLTGISRIFNAQTMRGRANVAMATYAGIGLLVSYFVLKPKSKK